MQHLAIQAGVAKIGKYAVSESGDTVEVVERPHGGVSLVMVDGQRSGRGAKAISNLVARKAISLLAEGVRDGAAARAAHDYLRTHRQGKVRAEMVILSVDLVSQTLVVSRNTQCPVLVRRGSDLVWLDAPSEAIGIRRHTRPTIQEMPLVAGLTVVAFSDGVWSAGAHLEGHMDVAQVVATVDPGHALSGQALADAILDAALALEKGRPRDDATVIVVKIVPHPGDDRVRRMGLYIPF